MNRALAATITLASTAALISGATVTAAQASQHGVSRASSARSEHFRIISTSTASRRQSVLATGAFTAGGYQIPGRVVSLRATDKMVFPGGTFLVVRRITRQYLPLPTSACLIRETIRGTYSLGHGTGSYAGISGSGAFTDRITGVIRRSHGQCGGPMTVYQQIAYEGGAIRG
ncbi:MAG TPA: hypothetical protein VMV07_08995 [Streptosporangiaceae bacterium]|nr:hypothetical protein [Streptosporangiaceae bacterium]